MSNPSFVDFRCKNCKTDIQASVDMIGQETECPVCGTAVVIPDATEDSVVRHATSDNAPEAIEAMKSRTIRIELSDF